MADPTARRAAEVVALAAVYAVLGRLGLLAEPVVGFATLIWPPTGVAIAWLVLRGRSAWPGVALGALAVNLWAGAPPPVAAGMATGNTLEALSAALLLARLGLHPAMDRLRDGVVLVTVALPCTAI